MADCRRYYGLEFVQLASVSKDIVVSRIAILRPAYSAVCYHNFRPPLVSEAPTCPLPDPDVEPDYYGDVRIKFPGSDSATSISNGAVFKAVSKFRKIMNEVAQKSFKEPQSSTYITLSDAYEAYEKLQTW